jgi:hypothetical protein
MAAKTSETITLPEYNGWANYPTWNAFLWLSNDQDTFNAFLAFGQTNPDLYDVTAYVKRYIVNGSRDASCRTDIQGWARHYGKSLLWALGQIDYEEIRGHLADAIEDAI